MSKKKKYYFVNLNPQISLMLNQLFASDKE